MAQITKEIFDRHLQYYLNKGNKTENMRDDIRLRDFAIQLGYTINYGDNFGSTLSFQKEIAGGYKIIWSTPYMKKNLLYTQWRCANVINDRYEKYSNYRLYDALETALKEEGK